MSGEKGVNLKNKNYFEDLLYWTSLIRPHVRGRGSCLKLGGQELNKRRKEVVWLDTQGSKSWVGNCPPCPPGSAVPACSWPKFLAKMQCLKCTNALRFQKTTFLFTCLRSTWRVFSCKKLFSCKIWCYLLCVSLASGYIIDSIRLSRMKRQFWDLGRKS